MNRHALYPIEERRVGFPMHTVKSFLCVILPVLAGCAGGSDVGRANPTTSAEQGVQPKILRPDSAGWRFVYLAGPQLELAYPVARVRAVRDRWSPQCDSTDRLFSSTEDDNTTDVLVVASVPAGFGAAARAAGFERATRGPGINCVGSGCGMEKWTLAEDGAWFGLEYADSVGGGPWRGLRGTEEMRGYFDDDTANNAANANDGPDTTEDGREVTRPPETHYRTRLFAVAPARGSCAVALAWHGGPEHRNPDQADDIPWDTALVRQMLSQTRLRR